MPITHQPGTTLAFQQAFRPIGRIRTGQQVEFTRRNGSKGKRPARLETFRLTSADDRMLERAAAAYGGRVEEWPEAPDGDALQLVTEARELDVLVPGGQPLSQWYEQWGAGGCLRRCTGEEETLSGGPCMCPPDPADRTELAAKGDACKPTTRVNLLLPDMDVGSWLLVSHSYYAAVELPPVVSLLADLATRQGRPVPAKLWIDQRRIKRPNQPPKEFSVPALRTPITWAGLLTAGEVIERPALTSGNGRASAHLPAGETPLPDDPPEVAPGSDDDDDAAWTDVVEALPLTGLSTAAFQALREQHEIAGTDVATLAREMFPAAPGLAALSDTDRAALWLALEARPVAAATGGAGTIERRQEAGG